MLIFDGIVYTGALYPAALINEASKVILVELSIGSEALIVNGADAKLVCWALFAAYAIFLGGDTTIGNLGLTLFFLLSRSAGITRRA